MKYLLLFAVFVSGCSSVNYASRENVMLAQMRASHNTPYHREDCKLVLNNHALVCEGE